jgi:tetratricopeptide (TPR) repeat protein
MFALLVVATTVVSCGQSVDVPRPDVSAADPLVADIVQRSIRKVENNPTSPAAWNDLGRACYANRFPAEADAALSRSLEWDASQPMVWYLRGMVRRDEYDLSGALDDFTAAMELDATSPHLRWRAAWVAMEHSDLPRAVDLADEAIRLAPTDRNAIRVRARLYLESETPEKGITLLEPLLQKNPADRDVLWLLVRLMRASGQAAEAKQWSDAAGNATPLYSDPWVQWAMAFKANPRMQSRRVLTMLEQGNLAGADKALKRFVSFYPDDPNGPLLEGIMLLKKGLPDMAEKHFEQLAAAEPDWAAPWQQLGMLRMRPRVGSTRPTKAALSAAIADLSKAIELDAQLTSARAVLGQALAMARQWGPAVAQFELCVESEPLVRSHRTNVAVALVQSGRADEAVAVLDAADAMLGDPPPAALAIRVRAEIKRGHLEAAEAALVRLVEVAPRHPSIPKIHAALQKARS